MKLKNYFRKICVFVVLNSVNTLYKGTEMNRGFDSNWLEELKYKCDIVEIISRYIPLQKKGGKYFGCCPFHHEKTASFCVNENEQYYHCFGCGVSGDVVKFVMEMESVDFIDACKVLADKVGMILPEFSSVLADKDKSRNERLLNLLTEAGRYYYRVLRDPVRGKDAMRYLHDRALDDETLKTYGIGLSDSEKGVINYLKSKGFSEKEMETCGVCSYGRDFYANRIIVPIFNQMGKIVAFGGRIYHGEKDVGKYKNSVNTVLFDKSKTIYGVNFVKKFKQDTLLDYIILVEGYMDVISLGAHGIKNAVAGMGTALTDGQARQLKRLCPNVYVCYDGDEAGRKAAIRNIDPLLNADMDVKVITLPDGYDPDDMMRKDGTEAFFKLLKDAMPAYDYKLLQIENGVDMRSVSGRAKYASGAVKILSEIKDEAQRGVYVELVSKKCGLSTDSLYEQMVSPVEEKEISVKNSSLEICDVDLKAARFVLNAMLKNKEYADISLLDREWFKSEIHKEIFDFVKSRKDNGEAITIGLLFDHVEESDEMNSVINNYENLSDESVEERFYADCVLKLANAYLTERIAQLTKTYEDETDMAKKSNLIQQIVALQRKLRASDIEDKR